MQVFPLDPAEPPSFNSLLGFLEACREEAEDANHAQLVSIATEVSALDPLAVLESIYETQQLHFYMERKQEGLAIAGAEVALQFTPSDSSTRFASAKAFIEETVANTLAVGDETLPFFGPHFFCGFTFFPENEESAPFSASTVFVPLWQVAVQKGRCVAIANVLVEGDSNVESIAKRIWSANTKFHSINYEENSVESEPATPLELLSSEEQGGESSFVESVQSALDLIERGKLEKIVIARALDLRANRPFHPLEILNTLRERYADCYAFSVANGKGQSFIGASPERFVAMKGGCVNIDILAGTASRGITASEDAKLGSQLLNSEKDLLEHRFVFDSVRRRLKELGIDNEQECRPVLKKLQNVQHLHVDLESECFESIHLLDLVESLHPTPAVGGKPRDVAMVKIPELEPFDRGLYAGPIGWVNAKGEGEFFVAIRSALVDGDSARLFAGVGIVEGSIPEKEYEETNLKFKALKENLL